MKDKERIEGVNRECPLSALEVGRGAKISRILATGSTLRRMNDLGFICEGEVVCVGSSIFGDPRAYLVSGAVIALRNSDADGIFLTHTEA